MRPSLLCTVALVALLAARAHAAPPPPIVSAFYYPWFATTVEDGSYAHWAQDGHDPPNDIASVYYPALGVYSSDDPAVLDAQMAEIRRAGINQIAVSWWGQGSPEDQRLPAILDAAAGFGIDVAVHIEPYSGRTVASVENDVSYLAGLGIRTIYIYQAFTGIPPAAWAAANDAWHADGLTTWGQTQLVGQAVAGHFSGVYTYDIVNWDGAKFARICGEAHRHGILCAPSVGPGYDARRATGDPHVKPRRRRQDLRLDVARGDRGRSRRGDDHVVQRVARGNTDRARGAARPARRLQLHLVRRRLGAHRRCRRAGVPRSHRLLGREVRQGVAIADVSDSHVTLSA